jgi:hypothetical protein
MLLVGREHHYVSQSSRSRFWGRRCRFSVWAQVKFPNERVGETERLLWAEARCRRRGETSRRETGAVLRVSQDLAARLGA